MAKTFNDVGDTIAANVDRMVANSVRRTLTKVNNAVLKLQRGMFSYIATNSGIINSGEAPKFKGIFLSQPRFKELAPDYYKRKKKKLGSLVGDSSFYMYSGYLKRYFNGIGNPLTTFGTPTIIWNRPGQRGYTASTFGNSSQGYTQEYFTSKGNPTNSFKALKRSLGTITVDLYPRIEGSLHEGMVMGQYFKTAKTIAYRLDNYHGGRNREFMPQFLEWWLRVKGKQVLRKAVS